MPSIAPLAGVFGDIHTDVFRVGTALLFGQSNAADGAGTATLSWAVGRLDGCATAYRGIISLAGCVRAEAGVLSGEGSEIAAAKRASRPWLDLGAGLALSKGLGAGFFARFEAFTVVPLVRDRFLFEPSTTIHRANRLVPQLSVSLGVWIL